VERDGVSVGEAFKRLGVSSSTDAGKSGHAPRQNSTQARDEKSKIAAPPSEVWQTCGMKLVEACEHALWDEKGKRALDWLRGRGFTDETIRAARLGWNGVERFDDPNRWDLTAGKKVCAPVGVVIPWIDGGALWRVQFRRLDLGNDPKERYVQVRGSADALYGADEVDARRSVVLCEGAFTSLAVRQSAGDLCVAVAAGSTSGGHSTQWIARLSLAPLVLVAFDADDAGDKAAERWLGILPGSRRRRPYWGDANDMAQDGADVRAWVAAGLRPLQTEHERAKAVPPLHEAIAALVKKDPELTRRFDEYVKIAEEFGIGAAREAIRRRGRQLWRDLQGLEEEAEASLCQELERFYDGQVSRERALYKMERWAQTLTNYVDCAANLS